MKPKSLGAADPAPNIRESAAVLSGMSRGCEEETLKGEVPQNDALSPWWLTLLALPLFLLPFLSVLLVDRPADLRFFLRSTLWTSIAVGLCSELTTVSQQSGFVFQGSCVTYALTRCSISVSVSLWWHRVTWALKLSLRSKKWSLVVLAQPEYAHLYQFWSPSLCTLLTWRSRSLVVAKPTKCLSQPKTSHM